MTTRKNTAASALDLTNEEKGAILSDAAGLLGTIIRLRAKVAEHGLTDKHGKALDDAFTTTIDALKQMSDASAANDSTALMVLERRLDQSTGKTIRLARRAARDAAKAD